MAITFDAAAESGIKLGISSYSFTHDISTANILWVFVVINDQTTAPTSVTFNSISMSHGDTLTVGITARVFIYTLTNPDAGSHLVAVSLDASTNSIALASSFNGISTATVAAVTNSGIGDPALVSVSASADDWLLDILLTNAPSITPDGSQTAIYNSSVIIATIGQSYKGPVPGNDSMEWSVGGGSNWFLATVRMTGDQPSPPDEILGATNNSTIQASAAMPRLFPRSTPVPY